MGRTAGEREREGERPDHLSDDLDLKNLNNGPPAPEPPGPGPVATSPLRFVPDRVMATIIVAVQKQRPDGTVVKISEVAFQGVQFLADPDADVGAFGVSLEKLLAQCCQQAPAEWAKSQGGG